MMKVMKTRTCGFGLMQGISPCDGLWIVSILLCTDQQMDDNYIIPWALLIWRIFKSFSLSLSLYVGFVIISTLYCFQVSKKYLISFDHCLGTLFFNSIYLDNSPTNTANFPDKLFNDQVTLRLRQRTSLSIIYTLENLYIAFTNTLC